MFKEQPILDKTNSKKIFQKEKNALKHRLGVINALIRAFSITIGLVCTLKYNILPELKLQIQQPILISIEFIVAFLTYSFFTAVLAPEIMKDYFQKSYEVQCFMLGLIVALVNLVSMQLYTKWYFKALSVLSYSACIFTVKFEQNIFLYIYPPCLCAISAHFYFRERMKRILYFQKHNSQKEIISYQQLIHNVLPAPILVIKLNEEQKTQNQLQNDQIISATQDTKGICVAYQNLCFQNVIKLQPVEMLKKIQVKQKSFYDTLTEQLKQKQSLHSENTYFHYGEVDEVLCCEMASDLGLNYYDLRWAECYWGEKSAIMIMFNDITHKKKFENELTRLSNYKDELLATVSHDLKTPLNGILTILEASRSEDRIDKIRENNEIAIKNSHLLNYLIEDIIDYSMINQGKLRIVCQPFDVLEAVQDVLKLQQEPADDKKISLKIIHELRSNQTQIYSDKRRLQQILLNLVSNALKFTNHGEIVVKLTLTQDQLLEISVRDSGCGIPQEIRNKIFQVFATYDVNNGSNRHGVGLGLTIAKKLVEELGPTSHIDLESEVGVGTCFSFKIFIQQRDLRKKQNSMQQDIILESSIKKDNQYFQQISHIQKSESLIGSSQTLQQQNIKVIDEPSIHDQGLNSLVKRNMQYVNFENSKIDKNLLAIFKILEYNSKYRFLVIDDQFYNIRGIQMIFEKIGIVVDGETSGEEALTKLQSVQKNQNYYEVLFVDVNMPGIDGLEVTRRVRRMINAREITAAKIVQCTAYTSDEDRKKCLEAGADQFLSKPVTVQSLYECFQKLYGVL